MVTAFGGFWRSEKKKPILIGDKARKHRGTT
jgi:hypothetical protein